MGRSPCCDKQGLKKGPWTPEEDKILVDYIQSHGHGSWRSLPKLAGLLRCGKSCRLRWTNYLRPDIKRGPFTDEEQKSIIQLHGIVGNKWSTIAAHLPGRTDNEIKNYWNTHLKKHLLRMGLNPDTYAPTSASAAASHSSSSPSAARHMAQWETARLEAEARLSRDPLLLFGSVSLSPSTPSSSAAAAKPLTANNPPPIKSEAEPEPADFFLRIWNSNVGEAFRKTAAAPEPASSSLGSSSTTKQSSAAPPEEPKELEAADHKTSSAPPEESSGSYGAEDASEETYRLYLDFAGDDMGLFHGNLAGFSLFGDLNEASLDTAFK